MSIPVFVSQVFATPTDVIGIGGTLTPIPMTANYFYISNKTSFGDGMSLLRQLNNMLTAASAATFTVSLTADLHLKLVHNSGGTVTVTMNRVLAWRLGFAMVFSTSYPPNVNLTIDIPVPTGAGGYTAEHRSPLLWCPERVVSATGPALFDPMISPGVQSSSGNTTRAPDGTAQRMATGVQIDAQFIFKGVEPYYRARAWDPNFAASYPHEREDCETWWKFGPRMGHKFLFYRNKAVVSFGTPQTTQTSLIAPDYVIYYPDAATAGKAQIVATIEGDLRYHDITIGCTLAKNGTVALT